MKIDGPWRITQPRPSVPVRENELPRKGTVFSDLPLRSLTGSREVGVSIQVTGEAGDPLEREGRERERER